MGRKHDSSTSRTSRCARTSPAARRNMLHDALKDFDPDDLEARLAETQGRARSRREEARADERPRARLHHADRARRHNQMSQNIDEITDKIEDVLPRIYCNNIREMRPDALELVDIVIRICEETKLMLGEFANFRHSKTLTHTS